MGRETDQVARQLQERAFLYADAESFRQGVRAAVEALNTLFDRPERTTPTRSEDERRTG